MNTASGTVKGIIQGPRNKIEEMKEWLSKEGSPASRIDKVEFLNERVLDSDVEFDSFTIKRKHQL